MGRRIDVFVIGGGPAGLAAAIAARQRGFSVTVADGLEPPIDKACGEGLMPATLRVLRELGVAMDAAEGFGFRGIRFIDDAAQVDASFPFGQGIGVRRPVLHQRMIEEAERLGITLLWKTPVTGIGAGSVIVGGKAIPAHWIVGADGIRSRVRRWCGIQQTTADPRYGFRRHYRVAPWADCVEVYWGRSAQAYVTPVGRDDVCVVVMSQNPELRSAAIAAEFPELAARLGAAEAEPESGAATLTCGLDRVYSDRVALVGDASGSVDAITGEGLCLSFQQALALADAFETGKLADYQMAHRRLARRPTFMGRMLLLLDRQPKLRARMLRSMETHPELFARLLAVHVGATSTMHFAATGALLGWRLVAA